MSFIAGHRTTQTLTFACPACGHKIDAATSVSDPDAAPKDGDYSVCFYCSSFLTFDANLQPVLLTDAEIASLPDEHRILMMRARRMIRQLHTGEDD